MKKLIALCILISSTAVGAFGQESLQERGGFYISTANLSGPISLWEIRPSIGIAVADNFVLNLGYSSVTITDGDYTDKTTQVALGAQYFFGPNIGVRL